MNRSLKTKTLILTMALSALVGMSSAFAQMPPHGGPPGAGGPPGDRVPPAIALATIPGLSAKQQTELRQILIQRRDALDSARQQWHSEFEALRVKQRNQRDRIDDQTTEQLRKALGDDGYKAYAEWRMAKHGRHGRHGPGRFGPMPPHGPHGHGPGEASAQPHGPMPPDAPGGDD